MPASRGCRTETRTRNRFTTWGALAGIALTVAGCPRPGADAGTTDSGTTALTVQIANVSAMNAFVEGCLRCGRGFQLWNVALSERFVLPTSIHCQCDDCTASACQGIADPPVAWIEIPPGETLSFTWSAERWDIVVGGCAGAGCLAPSPAPAGSYEVRVSYSLRSESSMDLPCTFGDPPFELVPFQSIATLASCSEVCAGVGCPSIGLLDSMRTANVSWPTETSVRVELGP